MRPSLFRGTVALVATLLLISGCGLLPKEAEDSPPALLPPVKTTKQVFTVTRGPIMERLQLRAIISARTEQTMFFRTQGRLKQRYVEAGQAVKQGQLLAELEVVSLHNSIEKSKIAVEKTELRLQQARQHANAPGGMDPIEERLLLLDIQSATIDLRALTTQLADSQIFAPFDGVVSDVKFNVGDVVSAFAMVVSIQDPSAPVIRADVDDNQLAKLAIGMTVQVEFSELSATPLPGKLVAVPTGLEALPTGQRTRQVQIEVLTPINTVRLGVVGRAAVVIQENAEAIIVPKSAVRTYAGSSYVVVIEGETRREVDVAIGIAGATEFEITQGLTEGQKVMGP